MIDIGRTKALAGFLFLLYWYFKTKNKIPLYAVILLAYIVFCTYFFMFVFPDIKFRTPTIEYLIYLVSVSIPFFIIMYKVAMMIDGMTDDNKKDLFKPVLERSRSNILFFTLIALMLLFSYLKRV